MAKQWLIVGLCILSASAYAADPTPALKQPTDLAAVLKRARSLRCHYTDGVIVQFKDGRRTVVAEKESSDVSYDDIDLPRGTARIVAATGAADITATWTFDSLWLAEIAPLGNKVTVVISAQYVAETTEFIVMESRLWTIGRFAASEQSSGSCTVLE